MTMLPVAKRDVVRGKYLFSVMIELCGCALSKDIETCGDCSEMSSCEKLVMITGNNEEALNRLKG